MTDYSKMSDFEINSAVHNAMLSEPYMLSFLGDDRIAWKRDNGETIITERVPYSKNGVHDYCNNPADTWPIIVENRIGIIPAPGNGKWRAAHRELGEDSTPHHLKQDDNLLRAAMIVFLMMQENSK